MYFTLANGARLLAKKTDIINYALMTHHNQLKTLFTDVLIDSAPHQHCPLADHVHVEVGSSETGVH